MVPSWSTPHYGGLDDYRNSVLANVKTILVISSAHQPNLTPAMYDQLKRHLTCRLFEAITIPNVVDPMFGQQHDPFVAVKNHTVLMSIRGRLYGMLSTTTA